MCCALACLGLGLNAHAQLDPVERRVFQAGYTQPLREYGPLAAYAFYYHNAPHVPATNLTLRLAVVPVYLDAELGLSEILGERTDLAFGLAGGGFADSYSEIRRGNYIPEESFLGHSVEGNISLYHRFNPDSRAPLFGVFRFGVHGSFFDASEDTDPRFEVPEDYPQFILRAGLRFGGREPYLTPTLAAEFSLWYEGALRPFGTEYGFGNDREIEPFSHLFWARALLAYTFESTGQRFEMSLNMGTGFSEDRFSAYRLGGNLELASEFPLRLPGYHAQEITAQRYVQFDANYLVPVEPSHHFHVGLFGAVAVTDYLDGLDQPGNLHSGLGSTLLYRSRSGAWQLGVGYAYGIQALRGDDRGGHAISFLIQYDLDAVYRAGEQPVWSPLTGSRIWRGIFGALGGRG